MEVRPNKFTSSMENQYQKQFPDIMEGKKIMYVHGFASSANSGTVTRIRTMLPSATVVADDIPVDPHEGLAMLRSMVEREQPDLIIGTSMGGMYTEQLHGFDRILVNPALRIADTMGAHGMVGKQTFQNPRKDGVQEFIVTNSGNADLEGVTAELTGDDAADYQVALSVPDGSSATINENATAPTYSTTSGRFLYIG